MAAHAAAMLKFQPLVSSLELPFWTELTRRKVEVFMLRTDPVPLTGFLLPGGGGVENKLFLGLDAFKDHSGRSHCARAAGQLVLTNTAEEYEALDKAALLKAAGEAVFDAIRSGAAMTDPSLLLGFLMICFGDLKKYSYRYLFGFPCLQLDSPAVVTAQTPLASLCAPRVLRDAHLALSGGSVDALLAVFLYRIDSPSEVTLARLDEWSDAWAAAAAAAAAGASGSGPHVGIAFMDACAHDRNLGWTARNILFLAKARLGLDHVHVLSFRDARLAEGDASQSLVFSLSLPGPRPDLAPTAAAPAVSGWEKDRSDRIRSKVVDLAASMDPTALMAEASSLNLKLMKWRLMPSLNLERVAATRVLLLGAGTLGCNVARALMGWGVRHITLVDNGMVSYSNPTRQSLFTFADAVGSATPKAECAAAALRGIYPGMVTEGVRLSIPMPGHAVPESEVEAVRASVAALIELYKRHDVVFLLTDTRESRWLPTLLGAAMDKAVINTAMGFDTFLVMRHGSGAGVPLPPTQPRLGCYFCADVVAARNSMADRTLDQQCTVTRSGLSMISSAMAAELLISVLHAPDGHHTPADDAVPLHEPPAAKLGIIPHQLRFFLPHYYTAVLRSVAYDCCTACSPRVVDLYRSNGFAFLLRAFSEPSYLEDVAGLTAMKAAVDAMGGFDDADAGSGAEGAGGDDDDF